MNLKIEFVNSTHINYKTREECIVYDDSFTWGLLHYPKNIRFKQVSRLRKEKYTIQVVKQKKKKILMFTTLLHELTHYIIAVFFKDNSKLHKILDRNNDRND